MSYYDKPVAVVKNTISREEFEQAWIIWEKSSGSLRTRNVRIACFVCLLALILILFPSYLSAYSTAWFPFLAVIIIGAGLFYLLFFKLKLVSAEAERMYVSNSLMGLEEEVTLTREEYHIVNQYEDIRGYWSEMDRCVETKRSFIITGGRERPLFILSKAKMKSEECEKISRHMQNVFASHYVDRNENE